jgi:ATP-dependent RNA helicase DDX24/MAK5
MQPLSEPKIAKKVDKKRKRPATIEPKVKSTQTSENPSKKKKARASLLGPSLVSLHGHLISKNAASQQLIEEPIYDDWSRIGVENHELLKNLASLGYTTPTPVQAKAIPAALKNYKDVVGAAETGSGKTLAYVLPILHRLLERRARLFTTDDVDEVDNDLSSTRKKKSFWRHLPALVLVPTRELAMQVQAHFAAMAENTDIRVIALVGGLAPQKQERLLRERPDVVVATPGRLWDIMSTNQNPFLERFDLLQFLVLDEADRLVEKGYFKELNSILFKIREAAANPDDNEDDEALKDETAERIIKEIEQRQAALRSEDDGLIDGAVEVIDVNALGLGFGESVEKKSITKYNLIDTPSHYRRQTFLFSATLGLATASATRDSAISFAQAQAQAAATSSENAGGDDKLKMNKKAFRRALAKAKGLTPVEALMARVGLLGKHELIQVEKKELIQVEKKGVKASSPPIVPELTDHSENGKLMASSAVTEAKGLCEGLPSTLTVARITCATDEKEIALYSFISRFPGRTLIFVNSVTMVRAVASLLDTLCVPVHTLHAHMQQRQRLQHLEKFRADPNGVLVATDVAARGLDVPSVDFVVQHSLPLAAETFIHRCGRTARGKTTGLALALVGPMDQKAYNKIMNTLGIPQGLPEFPNLLGDVSTSGSGLTERQVISRVSLARKITAEQQILDRESQQQQWLVNAAGAAGIDVDDEIAASVGADRADIEYAVQKSLSKAQRKGGNSAGPQAFSTDSAVDGSVDDFDRADDDEIAAAAYRRKKRIANIASLRRELQSLLLSSPSLKQASIASRAPHIDKKAGVSSESTLSATTSTQAHLISRSGSAIVAPRIDLASASVARVSSREAVLTLAKESRFIHETNRKKR